MKKINPIVEFIFSPLTAYLFIGTSLLFILYKFEIKIKELGAQTNSQFFNSKFAPEQYHKKGFWYTIIAIILFIPILFYDTILLIYVVCICIYEYVIQTVEDIYNEVVKQVQIMWEEIVSKFK